MVVHDLEVVDGATDRVRPQSHARVLELFAQLAELALEIAEHALQSLDGAAGGLAQGFLGATCLWLERFPGLLGLIRSSPARIAQLVADL